MITSEIIFYIGLVLIGVSILLTAVAVPVLILTGTGLRKQLNLEYGAKNRSKK